MSATEPAELLPPAAGTKSKKAKKKGKKTKGNPNGNSSHVNGHNDQAEADDAEPDGDDDESFDAPLPTSNKPSDIEVPADESPVEIPNGTSKNSIAVEGNTEVPVEELSTTATNTSSLTDQRITAAAQERDQLRVEVTELRKSLEDLQQRHDSESSAVKKELEEAKTGKDQAETQYRSLLGRVNTIKAQLGERLKADAEELETARTRIADLEKDVQEAHEAKDTVLADLANLRRDNSQQAQEIEDLRGRTNLSQQNWAKERDDLLSREAYAREEFESAKQAMQDWEVLAMEERSVREGLTERVAEIEEQLSTQKEAHEKAVSERDTHALTVDGLQRALQDIQDARKQELRELVESTSTQLEDLRKQLKVAEDTAAESNAELEKTKLELARALPFEKEVKEKNLLIGKQRHEAVILNDHLTKALRFLKKGKPEDSVDRQLVTNHFLHFLALDRSDQKKFQVLQLIASLLGWSEEEKEQAGLARPGAAAGNLRVPISPFRRTSSTLSLSADSPGAAAAGAASKESLAELWSDFLEREAHEGLTSPRSAIASPTGATPIGPLAAPSPK